MGGVVPIRRGKPGPKGMSDGEKKRRGTHREDRAQKPPPRVAGKASMPPGMSPEAQREWQRLAPHLHRLRLLTPVDRGAMTLLCEPSWTATRSSPIARPGPGGSGPRSSSRNTATCIHCGTRPVGRAACSSFAGRHLSKPGAAAEGLPAGVWANTQRQNKDRGPRPRGRRERDHAASARGVRDERS